ncbi:MAG: HEPN domain-containing protein [Nitrospirae bacterium]|nr:HEPN domain-containing protein [Nitrospirota bacterium]
MTLEPQDKKVLSDMRIEKACKYLQDASANFKEGRYETAVNRSYYAALNAVRSVLILEGVDPETHKGVITMLSLRFIKPALLSKDILKKFELLLARRTDVDYGDFEIVEASDAADSLKSAEQIIETIERVRTKLVAELMT